MKIMEAFHTLKSWLDERNINPPKVILQFQDMRDYAAFDAELRMATNKADAMFRTPAILNSLMGVEFEVRGPTYCQCEVCKVLRQIEDQHGRHPILRS